MFKYFLIVFFIFQFIGIAIVLRGFLGMVKENKKGDS